ncbi:MAG: hypothetical protein KC910_33295, partial [Candidatus Eremiobacteraeota bacterium]|nr:hypothetical protein [Candidatus Eremiobacteraeota bacterium]
MNSADRLMEEFENVALTVRQSPNANAVIPGLVLVEDRPLNRYRNSVANAALTYNERSATPRFMDSVGRLSVRETCQCNGVTVEQHWSYERNGQAEKYVFVRSFKEVGWRDCATLERSFEDDRLVFAT